MIKTQRRSRIFPSLRNVKTAVVSRPWLFHGLLKAINLPVIGDIYDFFYLKRVKAKALGSLRQIVIEPNNVCNLACIMCPYPDMERPKATMPLDLFQSIVDQAKEMGCLEVGLQQYNEPYTDKLLFDRIRHVRAHGMHCYYYSNGTLLLQNDNIAKTLADPPNLICFSLDGFTKETFEKIRVKGDRDKTYAGIEALYHERNRRGMTEPRIEIFFTLLEENRHELHEFQEYWKNRADFVSIFPVDARKDERFVKLDYQKLKAYPCFNQAEIIVLSNGTLALCCFDVNGGFEIGDLRHQTLREIISGRKFRGILESHFQRHGQPEMCLKCSKLRIDSAFYWWF
jgi:MoaA/NifB/PqqE/SkfB family radical SAM enzyme